MTVYAKNHQSLHKIYKFGSVSKLLAMTVMCTFDLLARYCRLVPIGPDDDN
jgi:hypothetical protein